jgi:hypothetical protein
LHSDGHTYPRLSGCVCQGCGHVHEACFPSPQRPLRLRCFAFDVPPSALGRDATGAFFPLVASDDTTREKSNRLTAARVGGKDKLLGLFFVFVSWIQRCDALTTKISALRKPSAWCLLAGRAPRGRSWPATRQDGSPFSEAARRLHSGNGGERVLKGRQIGLGRR